MQLQFCSPLFFFLIIQDIKPRGDGRTNRKEQSNAIMKNSFLELYNGNNFNINFKGELVILFATPI